METRQYQVYKFDELSQEAKQKAIEKWYEHEDYPFLEEDILQELQELDTLKIFSDIKLSYSLSCCQGDGLSFSASINLENWLKNKGMKTEDRTNILSDVYKVFSLGNKGRYCYPSILDIGWEGQGDENQKTIVYMDNAVAEIAVYYLDICHNLEKYGYSILEYRMDNKEFSEFCEENGYMFKENGTLD